LKGLLEITKTFGQPADSVVVHPQYLQIGQLLPQVLWQLLQFYITNGEFSEVVESQDALRKVAQWVFMDP